MQLQVALLLTGSYREDPDINSGLCKLHLRGETPADDAGDPVVAWASAASQPRRTSGIRHPGTAVANGLLAALRGGAAAGAESRHGPRLFGGAQQPASKKD